MAKERQNPVEAGREWDCQEKAQRLGTSEDKMAAHKEDLVSALESSLQV